MPFYIIVDETKLQAIDPTGRPISYLNYDEKKISEIKQLLDEEKKAAVLANINIMICYSEVDVTSFKDNKQQKADFLRSLTRLSRDEVAASGISEPFCGFALSVIRQYAQQYLKTCAQELLERNYPKFSSDAKLSKLFEDGDIDAIYDLVSHENGGMTKYLQEIGFLLTLDRYWFDKFIDSILELKVDQFIQEYLNHYLNKSEMVTGELAQKTQQALSAATAVLANSQNMTEYFRCLAAAIAGVISTSQINPGAPQFFIPFETLENPRFFHPPSYKITTESTVRMDLTGTFIGATNLDLSDAENSLLKYRAEHKSQVKKKTHYGLREVEIIAKSLQQIYDLDSLRRYKDNYPKGSVERNAYDLAIDSYNDEKSQKHSVSEVKSEETKDTKVSDAKSDLAKDNSVAEADYFPIVRQRLRMMLFNLLEQLVARDVRVRRVDLASFEAAKKELLQSVKEACDVSKVNDEGSLEFSLNNISSQVAKVSKFANLTDIEEELKSLLEPFVKKRSPTKV